MYLTTTGHNIADEIILMNSIKSSPVMKIKDVPCGVPCDNHVFDNFRD